MTVNSDFYKFCRAGATGDVVKAIGRGVDLNARDENGNTALIFAASKRPRVEIIKALLESGADAKAGNNDGATALMFAAAKTDRPGVITMMLNAGADANAELANGWTALLFAAMENPDPDVIGALYRGQARINHRAGDGTTALMLAAERNPNADVVRELIRCGADVNVKDSVGRTALTGAALRNSRLVGEPYPNPEIIDALLEGGADVNAVWDGDRAIDMVKDSPYLRGTETLTRLGTLSWDRTILIDAFLASLNLIPNSAAAYGKKLRYFFTWLDRRGVRQPEREDILAWRDELTSGDIKPVTAAGYLNLVRQFFRWAHREGLCGDITKGMEIPKIRREFRDDTLTREQVQRLLEGMDRDTVAGLRDYALLSLIVSCGLGYAETSRAKIGDIETDDGGAFLNVGGERVSVPDRVMNALKEYWDRRGKLEPDAPLFTGERTHKNQPVPVRTIGVIVRRAARRIGVDEERLTPGTLKHTAVRLALQSGRRIEEVRKFARHRYIGTTYRYGGASVERGNTCGDTVAAALF